MGVRPWGPNGSPLATLMVPLILAVSCFENGGFAHDQADRSDPDFEISFSTRSAFSSLTRSGLCPPGEVGVAVIKMPVVCFRSDVERH